MNNKSVLKFAIIFQLLFCDFLLSKKNQISVLPFMNSNIALKFIKKFLPKNPIILEAGAFDGTDTLQMRKLWPDSIIHVFEPVPKIFQKLKEKTKEFKNIFYNMKALSNSNGFAKFHLSEDPTNNQLITPSGSLLPAKEHKKFHNYTFDNSMLVKTITINSWAKKNKIEKVDLLWLDMQGFELPALKEGLDILKTAKVIYIEVEFVEAYATQPLYQEVKQWLELQNFELIALDTDPNKNWCGNAIFIKK